MYISVKEFSSKEDLISILKNNDLFIEFVSPDKHVKHFCCKQHLRYCIDIIENGLSIWAPRDNKATTLSVEQFLAEEDLDKDALALKEFIIFNIDLFSPKEK